MASTGQLADLDGETADVLRAMSHPVRLEILRMTSRQELPAGRLGEHLGLGQAQTSQHLRVLRDSGLVTVRRDGNRRLYRVNFELARRVRQTLDAIWAPAVDALKHAAEERHRREQP